MAAECAAWSAGAHLSALGSLASKLDRLERQAELLDTLQEEQEKSDLLKAYRGSGSSCGSPRARGAGSGLSQQVSELRAFIQAVADAEADRDEELLAVTASHTARYAVQLIRYATDLSSLPSQASQVVADLAAATLCMLCQRPATHEVLASAGAVPALLQLLDPLQSTCAVENASKALGNLSADAACRALLRSSGGVGSLARLLREDSPDAMQAAAAAALSLLAARDPVVSDTLRYLGALPLLVELLNSRASDVAEAARCCLLALKHNNPRNAAEILACLRGNAALCKDYWRLKDALLLLSETPTAAAAASLAAGSPGAALGHCRSPRAPFATPGAPSAGASPMSSLGGVSTGSSGSLSLGLSSGGLRQRPKSPARTAIAGLEAAVDDARREVAAAAVHVVEAVEDEVLAKKLRRAQRPMDALHANLDASIALLKASLADTRAAAAASKAAAAARVASAAAGKRTCGSLLRCSGGGGSSALLLDAPKSALSKHVMRYNCEELVALLGRMGLDAADTRALRKAGLSGAELLLLGEEQLMALLALPLHKARRLRRLQDAVALYDAIAARVAQARLSEVEIRLWLAAQGCSACEAGRVLKLLRSLVAAEPEGPACISAWEWCAGWTWVQHALEVYGVSWKV